MPELEPQFLDADPATGLPNISAAELRTVYDAFVPGVIGAGDLYVTPGAGRAVSVATGVAIVPGSSTGQAKYRCELAGSAMLSDNFESGAIPAATTNPRIDQIVARVYDNTFDSSGQRKWRLAVVAGTETAGATVAGRQGAAALPASSLLLADLITRPGMTAYAAADIVDRRTWAGGPVALVAGVPNNPPDGYITDWLANATNGTWLRYRYRFASPFASKWEGLTGIDYLYTSLPSAPFDGMVISYLADATNGVVWKLRYRAASTSASKWEVLGGSSLFAEVATRESTTSTTYVALATAGPSITVPLAGDYDVEVRCRAFSGSAGNPSYMSYDIGATAASDADAAWAAQAVANVDIASPARIRRKTVAAANSAIVTKYRTGAGTAFFEARALIVRPVRVG